MKLFEKIDDLKEKQDFDMLTEEITYEKALDDVKKLLREELKHAYIIPEDQIYGLGDGTYTKYYADAEKSFSKVEME
jgi:hypothetical protein